MGIREDLMRVRKWAPQEVKCGPILGPMPAFEAESRVQLFLLIKGGRSGGISFWMLLEARTRHGSLRHKCTEFLVLLFQRNTEIIFRRKRTKAWELKQRGKPKEEGRQEERDFKLHELAQQMDTFKGERRLEISKIENIFFGTNPVYELKPKQGTDDLILRNSSWLWLRKIKEKNLNYRPNMWISISPE